ncbi:MAG: hypothetical protein A2Y79_04220 [Deltaproteobacteria bacterium RBG_13_43_22]|nr:MAG: hypothetical protein A2Y79_04220 [Deltaproteobacteria bacterium RBG_13_43_22]
MKPIKVDTIPVDGLSIDFLLKPAWLKEIAQERPLGFVPSGPLTVHGELTKTGKDILFRGKVEGKIRLNCSRCLEPFLEKLEQPVRSEWRMVFTPLGSSDKEDVWQIEDLEAGLIKEGFLDLSERILEEVILSVPIKPLCRESCLGLCPICGENRNTNPCNCKFKDEDSPFSILKDYKV